MKHSTLFALTFALALALTGCDGATQTAASAPPPTAPTSTTTTPTSTTSAPASSNSAELAARLATAIESAPDRAGEILAAEGMTEEQFRALLYGVAADPELSEAYLAAR